MVDYNSEKDSKSGSFQKFFGGVYKGKEISEEEILFYRKDCDFLLDPQKWKKIELPEPNFLAKLFPDKTFYLANGILFVQRNFSPHYVSEGLPMKLYEISQKRFRNVKIEEPIGFGLQRKEGLLYHPYSDGVPLERINRKTQPEIRRGLARLLGKSTRTLHNNNILYYIPLSLLWFRNELSVDVRYDLESKIIYSPHQLMKFKKPTSNDRGRDIASLLCHFDWVDWKDTAVFLNGYYEKELNEDEIVRTMESIRKKAVAIHGLALRSHGIFYLSEEEKKIGKLRRQQIRLLEERTKREMSHKQNKILLEKYLGNG